MPARSARRRAGAGAATIERSEYTARLAGDDLLVGEATLHLIRNSNSPGLLNLAPWSLALGTANWQDQSEKPAELGSGPDGRCRVLVEGEQLRLQWSLRAERTASGGVGFEFEVPSCPTTRLTLDLPEDLELLVDRGIATKGKGPTEKSNRWTIALGGHHKTLLRIAAEGASRERRPLTLLRQAMTYELSPSGVMARAQLKLDIHGEPLQRIAVDLDPKLALIAARYGEQQIPFAASEAVETGATRVVLQLPEPIAGTGRVLQLSAIAPLDVGKQWRLPGLRVDGMAWQEGTATLLIPAELVLEQLIADGCQQSRVATLPAPAAGESIEIQYFRPGASLEVLLGEPRDELQINSGATIEVGLAQISGRETIYFSSLRGKHRELKASVTDSWMIDSVEYPERNRTLDWAIDEGLAGQSMLTVRLPESVAPGKDTHLIVRGHRPLPVAPSFESALLMPLSWDETIGGERLVNVRGVEGMDLKWAADTDLSRLDPLKLTAQQLNLFSQPPDGVLFSYNAAFARLTVRLERRRARYAADIRVDAAVQDKLLTETYTIQCTPETSRVDRLLVRFSQARDVPLDWNLAGANAGQFSARMLTESEQSSVGLPAGGEAWEVTVQLARPGAFELRAVRSTEFNELLPVSLAQLAQAAVQRGTLTIRAVGSSDVTIKNRRLSSVPAELLEADRYQTTRATFHYQPGRDDLGREAAVSLAPSHPRQPTSGAWAWSARLDSRYSAGETAVHWATLRIQTAGRQRIQVQLPAGARLHGAWVDDRRLPLVLSTSDKDSFAVDLPPGCAYATLTLYYTTPDGLPAFTRPVEAALPQIDIPILATQWMLWLPPGFEIPETSSRYPIDALLPPTLTQRLFGIMGRGANAEIFNPLVADDWQRLAPDGADDRAESATGLMFVEALGKRMAEYLSGIAESELTWGQLLALCTDDVAPSGLTVLVDDQSLGWQQLTPQQRVRFQPGDTPLARGAALLRHANLGVLVWRDAIALTAVTSIAGDARQIAACDHNVIFSVVEGPLAGKLHRAARERPIDLSLRLGLAGHAGTRRASLVCHRTCNRGHARHCRLANLYDACVAIGGSPSAHCSYQRRAVVGLADLLGDCRHWPMAPQSTADLSVGVQCAGRHAGAVVADCLWNRGRRRVLGLTGMLGFAHGASAKALGVRCRAAISLRCCVPASATGRVTFAGRCPLQRRRARHCATAASSNSRRRVRGASRECPAVPRYRISRRAARVSHSVVPSVRARRQRTAVARREVLRAGGPVQAIAATGGVGQRSTKGLAGDACRVSRRVARDPVTKQLRLTQLKASFDINVLSAQAQVRVPFPHDVANDAVVGARLDGRAIPMTWTASGDALDLGTLSGERYQLELDLQARLRAYGASAGFDVPIPPIAVAEVELTVPPDAPTIEIPTARGQVVTQKELRRIQAHLGAGDRLSVRWPAGIGMETATANIEAEELIWVKVRPGTTVFDVRFKYRVLEGSMRQIRLLADPRLQLLPSTSTTSHVIPGDPQRIDLELARTVSDQATIDLSFLLTGTSGVGNLQFPRLESSGVRAARRWLAVSVDPALESKEFPGEDTRPMAIADFMAAWGAANARPQAAYQIPRGEAMWVLATQPSKPQLHVQETTAISLARDASLVEYDAALAIDGGYLFQLRIDGPKSFAIDQVSLFEDGVQRVARWSTGKDGRTTVFLTGPINGNQKATVRGRITSSTPGKFSIPRFAFVDAHLDHVLWRIYRQSNLLVDVKPGPGVTAVQLPEPEPRDSFGTLVGSFQSDDPQAAISADISPNTPQTSAIAVTRLTRDGDRWIAELHCHVKVEDGLVDALSFEVPPQWAEPYRTDPPARTRLVPIPGEPRAQLLIYPPEPIKDEFDIAIRGRVALLAGDRLRTPNIVPQRFDRVERFVVLPERLDLQQISWETVGLSRADLPAEFAAIQGDGAANIVYRADGDQFQASLRGVQRAASTARVKLADIHVAWKSDGYCQGVASFDIEPAGATRCTLELPTAHQLVHASIEGLPAQLIKTGDGLWQVSLGPAQLPQRLDVVFRGPYGGTGEHKRFEAPCLPELEVDETLWTIYSPDQFTAQSADSQADAITGSEQELRRLRATAALSQLPAEIVGEHLPDEIARWYQPWRRRYAASRAGLGQSLASGQQDLEQSTEEIEARQLDARITAVDARLAARSPSPRSLAISRTPAELLQVGQTPFNTARYVVERKRERSI